MAYLLTTHIIKGNADLSGLSDIPKEISFKAYREREADFTCIDFFSSGKENKYPFQRMLPATGLPLIFEGDDVALNDLYEGLKKSSAANSFKRALVNLNKIVSEKLCAEVLSIASDDDGLDLAVKSNNGVLQDLRFRAEDIEILYDSKSIIVQPLLTEEDESFVDLNNFQSEAFELKERNKDFCTELHYIALKSVQAFLGTNEKVLGLGSFDPEPLNLEEVIFQTSSQSNTLQEIDKEKSPWWKFWSK